MSNQIEADEQPTLNLPVEENAPSPTAGSVPLASRSSARQRSRSDRSDAPVASSQPTPKYDPVQLDAFAGSSDAAGDGPGRFDAVGSNNPGIVLVDPFAIEPEPFNGRGLAVFDPARNRDLIDAMRVRGNTVPVRLRPRADGQGWTCASGSRRVNAGRIIAANQPGFRVAAIIDESMTDTEAYALCLADNRGRNGVTALQQGREIKWAIAHLHGGSRQAYIDEHGTDKSVVSRALELVNLPEAVLAAAEDREALSTLFAEKLAPKLKDKVERKVVFARLKALGTDRLPGPRLLAYLLTGNREAPAPDRRIVRLGTGRDRVIASITVAPDRSAVLKVPALGSLTVEQRTELQAFLNHEIGNLLDLASNVEV